MNIYFCGIGGVGLGPLAEIALDAGHTVVGSDPVIGLMTRHLVERGVAIYTDQAGEALQSAHDHQPIDWFVYTSAISTDHPELLLAQSLGIKTSKRDELLASIIDEKNLKLIAVAGTHGKTTTTGMLIWTLEQLNIPISYSVGSTLSFGPSGKFDPKSDYFVYECDEFDRNFLHFTPYLSLITSLDYDHPDTYPTDEDYKSAFRQFISQSESVVMWQKDSDYIDSSYPNAWYMQEDEVLPLQIKGEHNRRNGTLVLKAIERMAIAENNNVRPALESFPGTGRRFEQLLPNLYTDYGHHPAEIAATLQMARELNDTVVLVYQPHQNVRQHEIRNQYTDSFNLASQIFWLPTYLTREDHELAILTPAELTATITNRAIHIVELDDNLWSAIEHAREQGALVLCMGAGSIDDWIRSKITE